MLYELSNPSMGPYKIKEKVTDIMVWSQPTPLNSQMRLKQYEEVSSLTKNVELL